MPETFSYEQVDEKMDSLLRPVGLRAQVSGSLGVYVALNLALTLIFVGMTFNAATGAALFQQQETATSAAKELERQLNFEEAALVGIAKTDDALLMTPETARGVLNQVRIQSPSLITLTTYGITGNERLQVSFREESPRLPPGTVSAEMVRRVLQGIPYRTDLWWSGGYPFMAIAVPLSDRNLQITGILVGTAEIPGLWETVRNMGDYGKSQVYVTDRGGRLILARDLSLLRGSGAFQHPPLAAKVLADLPTGGIGPGLDGTPVLSAWTALKGTGWIVVAEIRSAWAFSAFQILYGLVGIQLLLGLIAGWVFGLYLEKRVVGPLVRLSAQAREFGRGNFSTPAQVAADGEIGSLATSLNQMAAQLSDLVGQLETRVADRTRELSQARDETERSYKELQQTQSHLIENERLASLGKLVAGVAHEINTPVGNALTASSFLAHQAATLKALVAQEALEKQVFFSFLEDLEESSRLICNNLVRAADQISSFKKVAVNQTSEEAQEFDLSPLLQDVAVSFRHELKVEGHRIDLNCPENLRLVSHQGLLIQILTNLVQNSIFHGFRDRREGTISVTAAVNAGFLDLDYRDNGWGIPEDLHGKVFEPFFTTRKGSGGSGLGLSIVKNIVVGPLGGTITLENNPEGGARFRISIPVGNSPGSGGLP